MVQEVSRWSREVSRWSKEVSWWSRRSAGGPGGLQVVPAALQAVQDDAGLSPVCLLGRMLSQKLPSRPQPAPSSPG